MKTSCLLSSRQTSLIPIIFLAVPFLYSLIRAAVVPVFHDEAVTYVLHARLSFNDILTYAGPCTPNNHLLNTLMIKIFTQIFGLSDVALRLPALIGHALYLAAALRISRLLSGDFSCIPALCLLTLQPFLLELFSAARGYALACGFLMWGIYHFLTIVGQRSPGLNRKKIFACLFFTALATSANISFLYAYLAVFISIGILWIKRCSAGRLPGQEKIPLLFLKDAGLPALISLILVRILCVGPLNHILMSGHYYNGGKTGLWKDTIGGLIPAVLYNSNPGGPARIFIISLFIAVPLAGILILIVLRFLKKRPSRFLNLYNWLLFLMGICLLLISGSSIVLGTKYPLGRTAVFLLVFFLLNLLTLLSAGMHSGLTAVRKTAAAALIALAVLQVIHFDRAVNFTTTMICPYTSAVKQVMQIIKTRHEKINSVPARQITLSTHWIFSPVVNYYRLRYDMTWLKPVSVYGEIGTTDYYYLVNKGSPDIEAFQLGRDLHHAGNYLLVPVFSDPSTQTTLFIPYRQQHPSRKRTVSKKEHHP